MQARELHETPRESEPPARAIVFEDRTDPSTARAILEIEWARTWVRNERARGEQPS